MVWIAWAIVVCAGLACGAYLVVNGHPWIGTAAIVLPLFVSISDKSDKPPAVAP